MSVIVQYSLVDDECQSVDEWKTCENIDTAFFLKPFDKIGDICAISFGYLSIVSPHVQVEVREGNSIGELQIVAFKDSQLGPEGLANGHDAEFVHIDRFPKLRHDLVIEP